MNIVPPMAGPAARPIALTEVAKPFKVPRTRKLLALFVRRIVLHGNAKMAAQHLTTITANWQAIWLSNVGSRAVNGVMKYVIGNAIAHALRQFSTPNRRAIGGNRVNCT